MNKRIILFIILSTIFMIYCSKKKPVSESGLTVTVSILPQKFFVDKIIGDKGDVIALVGPGKSPHSYEPTPQQMEQLSLSKIFFSIGVPFEHALMPKLVDIKKTLKIIDTSKGIDKIKMTVHHHKDEHHEKKLHDAMMDPHIWLSPRLVKIQAENIYKSLSDANPDHKEYFKSNYQNFLKELDLLDKKIAGKLKPYSGKTVISYHPVLGYFAKDYKLIQKAIEIGGKEPTPSQLTKIIEEIKKNNGKIIFLQPEFSQKSGQAIARAINASVAMLNTLDSNYIENMEKIANEIAGAFKK